MDDFIDEEDGKRRHSPLCKLIPEEDFNGVNSGILLLDSRAPYSSINNTMITPETGCPSTQRFG